MKNQLLALTANNWVLSYFMRNSYWHLIISRPFVSFIKVPNLYTYYLGIFLQNKTNKHA